MGEVYRAKDTRLDREVAIKIRLMVAQVPVAGVTTVHSVLGDAFGWATVVGFVMLLGWVIVASRRAKRTEMA